MQFLDLAKERYSVRKFSDKPVEQEKLDLILEAGRIAPTAHNNQPQRILVLQGKEAMERLEPCTPYRFGQTLSLLVCYDKTASWKREEFDKADAGETDASIVTTHMMLQGQELGIGSTWVGHFDPQAVRETFDLPPHIVPVVLLMMGYPREDARPSRLHESRLEKEKTIFYDHFSF